jgi:hypothetical protein
LKQRWFKIYLLGKIAYWLFIARVLLLCRPFKTMAKQLGVEQKEVLVEQERCSKNYQICGFIRKWMPKVALVLPFKCKCLSQAYAAAKILQRYDISYTIYFGVSNDDEKETSSFKAHAWTIVGTKAVTGGRVARQFKVINCFGSLSSS